MVTYKEGGIFDSGSRQKMELAKMDFKAEEVLEGLPSLTVYLEPEKGSPGEIDPEPVLAEVGKNISFSSRQDDSASQIVNVDFETNPGSETAEIQMKFRFNASTAVDYNDDEYESAYRVFLNLVNSEIYSSVSVESTPTPDGGRSVNVETAMKNTVNDNSPLEISNAWSGLVSSLGRFVGSEGNLSSVKMHSKSSSLSADFFNQDTYNNAAEADRDVFYLMDAISNSSSAGAIKDSNFNISAVGSDDSTLTVLLDSDVTEDSFERLSNTVFDSLKRSGYASSEWTIVVSVDGKPELSSVVFGTLSTV